MLNRVVLIGRLTKEPELRFTQGGTAVGSFTLAVDRPYKGQDGEKQTDFIDVTVWRQLAETCAQYLSKGKLAAVDGSLQTRTYEAQDGSKRKVYFVSADQVRFLSPKDQQGATQQAETEPMMDGPFGQASDDDDLPF